MTDDEMKSEIAYINRRHKEECEILAAERDYWKVKYEAILQLITAQELMRPPTPIQVSLTDKQLAYIIDTTQRPRLESEDTQDE